MTVHPTELSTADPFLAVRAGQRHDVFRALAAEGPIHRIVLPNGAPAWLVTGYQRSTTIAAAHRAAHRPR